VRAFYCKITQKSSLAGSTGFVKRLSAQYSEAEGDVGICEYCGDEYVEFISDFHAGKPSMDYF